MWVYVAESYVLDPFRVFPYYMQAYMIDIAPQYASWEDLLQCYNFWGLYTEVSDCTSLDFIQAQLSFYDYVRGVERDMYFFLGKSDQEEKSRLFSPDAHDALQEQVNETMSGTYEAFGKLCNEAEGCTFNSDEDILECSDVIEWTNPHATFRIVVIAAAGVVLFKELVKCAILFWCLCKGSSPPSVRRLCQTCLLLPAVAISPQVLKEIITHEEYDHQEKIFADEVLEFIFHLVLEDGPQLSIGLYYTFNVAAIGVSTMGLVSMFVSFVSMTKAIGVVIYAVMSSGPAKPLAEKSSGNVMSDATDL